MNDVKELNEEQLDTITGGALGFSSGQEKQEQTVSFENKFKSVVPEGLYSQLYGCLFGQRVINLALYNGLIDKYYNYINNPQTVTDLKNFPNGFNTCEINF